MKKYCKYLILLLLFSAISCEEKPQPQPAPISKNEMKNSMETANRYLLNEEEEDIANYIKRHELEMTSTGTGCAIRFCSKVRRSGLRRVRR